MLDLRHIEFRPAPAAMVCSGTASPGFWVKERNTPEVRTFGPSEAWCLISEILNYVGVDPRIYRASALERRVPALLRRLRVTTPDAARALLHRSPELLGGALGTVLIGVTEFFRDPAVFDYLRKTALPDLLRVRPKLRILSVGASDGSELYSTAIMLAEAGVLGRCELAGIDCRRDAVDQARSATFRLEALNAMRPEWRERYFIIREGKAVLRPEIVSAALFSVADVFTYLAPRPWDLILFRNVSMYFTPSATARVWQHLAQQLNTGGLLITGKAEQPMAGLGFLRLAACIYRKQSSGDLAKGISQ